MAIWGKIIGSTAGFALGGPLGALMGAAVGHGVDKVSIQKKTGYHEKNDIKEEIFATGVIALAAKIAKADGKVSKEEILSFKRLFDFSKEDELAVAKLYNLAKEDSNNFSIYAEQLFNEFKNQKSLLLEILNSLFAIAASDKHFHPKEEEMLSGIAKIFCINEIEYNKIKYLHVKQNGTKREISSSYKVLGANENDSLAEITSKYKDLVKNYHPDRLQGMGLPEDFIKLANEKLSAANEAYNEIKKYKK